MEPKIRLKGFSGEWQNQKLGEIASFSKGSGYSKSDLCNEGNPIILYGRLYTKYEPVINEVDTFTIPRDGSVYSKGGEVIIPGSGETPEDISIASSVKKAGVILGGDLNVLSFDSSTHDSAFMAMAVTNSKTHRELSKYAQGKTIVHLHNSEIAKGAVAIPSLKEQKDIVKFVLTIDSLIQSATKKMESLKQVKAASLQAMFPQEGETVPKVRFKGFEGDWKTVKLGEVGTFRSNGVDKKIYPNDPIVNLLNYLDVYNFKVVTNLNCHELMQVSATEKQIKECDIKKGDIFFTPSSETAEDIGHVMVAQEDLSNTCYSYHLVRFRPNPNQFYITFPNYGFQTEAVRKQMRIAAKGVQRFVMGKLDFENIIVVVPSYEEQKMIGDFLSTLDTQITLQSQRVEKLKQIKSACLDQMFV